MNRGMASTSPSLKCATNSWIRASASSGFIVALRSRSECTEVLHRTRRVLRGWRRHPQPSAKESSMEPTNFSPDWRELVTYAAPRPQPAFLRDEEGLRVLVAGLEPGGQIPAHPERLAVYHFLEGTGSMVVGDAQ